MRTSSTSGSCCPSTLTSPSSWRLDSPCQDNSNVRENKKGIRGEKSSLICDIVAFFRRLKAAHRSTGWRSQIHFSWENVCGTTKEDAEQVAKLTGTLSPIELNVEEVAYASRPRVW